MRPCVRLRAVPVFFAAAIFIGLVGTVSTASEHTVTSSVVAPTVPEVFLIRDDGKKVSLRDEMDDGRPVFVNFIFTSCPGICPLMSESFRQLQSRLGVDRARVHMISISIDPEQDKPARLREYAARFQAGPQWQHYTGTLDASLAVQRAFGVYNGDKMSHAPIAFFRAAPGESWVALQGLATGNDLHRTFKDGTLQRAASR